MTCLITIARVVPSRKRCLLGVLGQLKYAVVVSHRRLVLMTCSLLLWAMFFTACEWQGQHQLFPCAEKRIFHEWVPDEWVLCEDTPFYTQFGALHSPHDNGRNEFRNVCRRLGTMKTCGCSGAFDCVAEFLRRHVTATHGWSGHVRFNIPDVSGLRDRSAIIGDLDELDSAVVICLSDPHRIQVWIGAMLALCASFDHWHASHVARMWLRLAVSRLLFWMISLCFHSLMNCKSAWNEAFNIASWPNTNCVGVARAAVCTAEFMAFRHATRTHLKPRKESESRLHLICALGIMLGSVLWHLSIMEFACGLRLVTILHLTSHSFARVSLTSLSNSFHLSIVISAGHGHCAREMFRVHKI